MAVGQWTVKPGYTSGFRAMDSHPGVCTPYEGNAFGGFVAPDAAWNTIGYERGNYSGAVEIQLAACGVSNTGNTRSLTILYGTSSLTIASLPSTWKLYRAKFWTVAGIKHKQLDVWNTSTLVWDPVIADTSDGAGSWTNVKIGLVGTNCSESGSYYSRVYLDKISAISIQA